ncbi:MAG: flagellar basal-body MS-ring/collar protein FliF [Bacillota bacterium]
MAAIGQGLGRQALSLWDQMSASQKVMVLLAIGLGVVAIVLLLSRAGKTDMVPLYTNLGAEDAADIVAKLRELRIAYEISDGGKTVRVPFRDVYETRMNLASQGLPKDGTVGFEIFDKTSFGITEFTQKMNYRRALQGELTRTILQLREVEEARVHIAIPEPELYTDEVKPPTASVMVKLKAGAALTKGQVQGIVRLVASSVEGLSPNNITVLDVDGNVLHAASDDSPETGAMPSLTLSQLEAKRAYEKDLEKSVESMLTEVLGPRKVVVRVNAEINFDRTEQNSETFQPLPSGLGVIREQARSREARSTSVAGAGGVPGIASNVDESAQGASLSAGPAPGAGSVPGPAGSSAIAGVPGTTSVPGTTGAASGTGAADAASAAPAGGVYRVGERHGEVTAEERTEETTKYEVSRVVEHRVKAPGEVKRLSVAAIVAAPLTEAQQQAISRSIGAAVGLDPGRGDSLIVEAMQFGAPLASQGETEPLAGAEVARTPAKFGEVFMANIEYVLAGIIGLFLAGLVISVTRQRMPAPPALVPAPVVTPVTQAAAQEVSEADTGRQAYPREKAQTRPAPKPETAARVITGWMSEDKR